MGKEKYQRQIQELFKKSPVVDSNSIIRIIKNKKNVKQYDKQIIKILLKKGKIKRLTKGYYTIHDEISLTVLCFKQSYLGLQDALSFHNLWEQETIPIIITTKKIRPGLRKVLGTNILIRRINKKYFFGYNYEKQGNFYLPYSDIEKTFIDMIYFKQKISLEVLKEIKKQIATKKLNIYLKKYNKKFRNKILGIYKI